jgi:hypothetical protein
LNSANRSVAEVGKLVVRQIARVRGFHENQATQEIASCIDNYETISISNFFLKDSVDERVYQVLRERCGLFEHFVGPMQPVLMKARGILITGAGHYAENDLNQSVADAKADELAAETYIEHDAVATESEGPPPVRREDLWTALDFFDGAFGVEVRKHETANIVTCKWAGAGTVIFAGREGLDADISARPLCPLDADLRAVAESLRHAGERLPLVVGVAQSGPFRASVIKWLDGDCTTPVNGWEELSQRVLAWNGVVPDPSNWLRAHQEATAEAQERARQDEQRAAEAQEANRQAQLRAANLRLRKELALFLVCLGDGSPNLNTSCEHHLRQQNATSQRLQHCLEKLGGYPSWSDEEVRLALAYYEGLRPSQVDARKFGTEVQAALNDPRWVAM